MGFKSQAKNALRDYTGLTTHRWRARPNGLYCVNYHRIGDPDATDYDPGLYSCTEERFYEHVQFLRSEFEVISTDDIPSLDSSGSLYKDRYAVITFDDGYHDNYELAFPALRSLKAPATFFVPTDYIGSVTIPWWDEIAWMVKQCSLPEIRLPHWTSPETVNRVDMTMTLRRMIRRLKTNDGISIEEKMDALRKVTQLQWSPEGKARLFVSEAELREMSSAGMSIGSHTCSHRILSHLSIKEQREEIQQSKRRLESILHKPVNSFAYPVGGAAAFSEDTMQLVKEAGYQTGFSFISGVNLSLKNLRFQVRRMAAEEDCPVRDLKRNIAFTRCTS